MTAAFFEFLVLCFLLALCFLDAVEDQQLGAAGQF
jgi:hypothetical protein